jgi:hypothetical protein
MGTPARFMASESVTSDGTYYHSNKPLRFGL